MRGSCRFAMAVHALTVLASQWLLDAAPIPGQPNDFIAVPSAQGVNSWVYSVSVSSEFGTVSVLVPLALESPLVQSDGTIHLMFRGCDGSIGGELSNISVQWRTNLPSGTDTNWQALTSGALPNYAKAQGSDIQQFASFDEEAQLLIANGETAKIRPRANSRWFAESARVIKLARSAFTRRLHTVY